MHDYEAVLVDCDRALSIASEHGSSFEDKGKALARKGKALAKLKRYDEAISTFEDSLLEYEDSKIEKVLRKTRADKKKADALAYLDPEKAMAAKEEGNKLFRDGKFGESIKFTVRPSSVIRRMVRDVLECWRVYQSYPRSYDKTISTTLKHQPQVRST